MSVSEFRGVAQRAKRLRDTQLAHRQVRPVPIPSSEDFDQAVEDFFRETSVLVNGLMSLVQGVACDLSEAAEVYAFYAKCFWTTVGKKSMAPCDAAEPGKVSGTELAPGNSA
ncbi:hypothetical protein GCM10008024_40050 [Allgaiera indica]|uniref:Uncharacterized protein n=1 Tax=Allgaiera indica TaxID=765699 RepID=A0AAN5A2Z6_9RHOB|nr:hypothetical protein GCM10008024_40050 [Allgaiera indica]